ncbi:hypothetical protein EV652_10364 [Kribbella steppae]|uniref:Uncharacterized protein n=1 Tax=Kribbella steppae TaxID=2512223 RepID=A0A4R2HSV5_9ACTN|nr:hypothetical protein [Kribbella steppae]TCO33065.1 hypothetical protein EV652_10364 [Kribbella steppae]
MAWAKADYAAESATSYAVTDALSRDTVHDANWSQLVLVELSTVPMEATPDA